VLDDQLALLAEQVSERYRPVRPVEDVLLLDPDHGQQAPPGVECLALPGLLLFPREQPDPGLKPLFA